MNTKTTKYTGYPMCGRADLNTLRRTRQEPDGAYVKVTSRCPAVHLPEWSIVKEHGISRIETGTVKRRVPNSEQRKRIREENKQLRLKACARSGFTLIELLVVIAIIGILAAMLLRR